MSKFVIYLLVLLNFYCYGIRVFELNKKNLNKNKVDIRLGEQFAVKIPSNPTTGYVTTFINSNEVSNSLELLRDKFVPSANLKNLVGAGGHHYFYFKAMKVTNEAQTLKFANVRSYEKQTNVADYTLNVNVY